MSRSQIVARVEGVEDLERRLKKIGRAGKEILNKSLFKGAGVFRDAAVANASRLGMGDADSRKNRMFRGRLLRNTKNVGLAKGIIRKRDKVTNQYEERIYVQSNAYYSHMIEFGHHWVVPDRSGRKHVLSKKYAPHPFMTPAYESNRERAKDVIAKEAARLIAKETAA